MPSLAPISNAPYLRTRPGKVCVALSASTPQDLFHRAETALAESHFLEFRLDSLPHPAEAISHLASFLSEHKDLAAIATCRRKAYGGAFSGTLSEELAILQSAAEAGAAIVDLEIESAEEATTAVLDSFREALTEAGTALLLSFHDFQSASDPEAAFTRIDAFGPDYVKIVTTAHTLTEGLNLLHWIKNRSSDTQLIGIAMGEPGIVSRVLSLRAGAAFTFAAAPDGATTAPGQMTARTLRDLYHIEQLDQATRIYGVAGNPISHSLSPLMQNTAFRRERINAVYLPLKVESLEDLLVFTRKLPLSGLSVTMPLKQQILPHLANSDPFAVKLGAVNTIRLGADGKLYGFNTDVAGIVRPLEKRLPLKGASILVLGAGGAARAAVYGLADKGAKVAIWSRKESAAKELAADSNTITVTREEIARTQFDVLINATPCGMTGNPHPLPIEGDDWHAKLVFDLVYNPLDTPLLQIAKARGMAIIQGVEMFVHQAPANSSYGPAKPPPEAEMLRTVLFALNKSH